MDLEKAIHVTPSIQGAGSDTVYFCVVDGKGNACSMINR
jgi:gamma-glutamyltranspeptidase